ncbi:hypothetical protein AMR74_15570 [Halorubrum tropicale]|uniref:Uncharacterized protein n=1 Tax=Halorubrum tropicale TaxID=1765655 RepID=A0A0N0BQF8_9EURY|nr:hypothetical protein AMR74_15570 [Halorubrum tropicale]
MAFFEEFTELLELCRGELRRRQAAESGTESFDTAIIPCASPSTCRSSRDSDAVACLLACIAHVDILHVAESSDETGLVRLLSFADRLIKFHLGQMSHEKTTLTALHRILEALRGVNSFADYSRHRYSP